MEENSMNGTGYFRYVVIKHILGIMGRKRQKGERFMWKHLSTRRNIKI